MNPEGPFKYYVKLILASNYEFNGKSFYFRNNGLLCPFAENCENEEVKMAYVASKLDCQIIFRRGANCVLKKGQTG